MNLVLRLPIPLPKFRQGSDLTLLCMAACLLGWGLVMVASASVSLAERSHHDAFYYFYRQIAFAGMGVLIGGAVFLVPMHVWERRSGWLAVGALVLLTLVLIPGIGVRVNSARRWIDFGVMRVQVSEPARLALLMFMAGYIVRRQGRLQNSWKGLLMPFLPLFGAGMLLLLEPDFGGTVVLFAVAFTMLFLGGARLWHLSVLIVLAGLASTTLVFAAAYRLRRLFSFLDPFKDPMGDGWQLTNSLIAIAMGGVDGVGLGNSKQKLDYLPEMHTDFIFAILAEEFGLIGVLVLLVLFAVLVWRAFAIGKAAETLDERFKAYLCYGIGAWLALQVLVNFAVNLGALPTKGLTLPLISYGGSSLIVVIMMLALLLRVDYENRLVSKGRAQERRR